MRVGQLPDLRGEADEFGLFCSAQSQQTELVAAVYGGEYRFAVFDVVQADQLQVLGDVAEIGLGAVVGCNAGGHDKARPPCVSINLQNGFGK
ncbi:hypothetical protein D3C85_1515310 [compost metagenome]